MSDYQSEVKRIYLFCLPEIESGDSKFEHSDMGCCEAAQGSFDRANHCTLDLHHLHHLSGVERISEILGDV